jgi:hypothetical protein
MGNRVILIICFVSVFNICFSQHDMKGKKIKKKEVEKLIKEFGGRVDRSILDSVPLDLYGDEEIYRLSDNRILFKLDEGDGMLYNSLKDILEIYSTDSVAKIPKADEKFLIQIPALVKELSDTLKLNLKMSDKLNDLSKLDSAIRARGGITSVNAYEHLLPLVAYCGQVMVNETGGIWEVKRENEGEPQLFVKGSDGKVYDPYNRVLALITDAEDDFSFEGIIEYLVKPPFKLKPAGGRDH